MLYLHQRRKMFTENMFQSTRIKSLITRDLEQIEFELGCCYDFVVSSHLQSLWKRSGDAVLDDEMTFALTCFVWTA